MYCLLIAGSAFGLYKGDVKTNSYAIAGVLSDYINQQKLTKTNKNKRQKPKEIYGRIDIMVFASS